MSNKVDEIKLDNRSKIATIQLNNGQTDNLMYEVDASYSETSNINKAIPSDAFEVINGELWYTGDVLEGNVNVKVNVKDGTNSTAISTEPMSFLYSAPLPDPTDNFNTNIKGGKASDIEEYNLSNPNATPVYSLVSATYVNGGGDASAAFEVDSSSGALSYNGDTLTGDVIIQAKVSDNGVEYNFTSVTLNYTDAPSPINPLPADLNTNINEGITSDIGTFLLKDAVGSVAYSVSASYINGGGVAPSAAFEVNTTIGMLSYVGSPLDGDVEVTVTATNDGIECIFDPVELFYNHPSPNNPDPATLNVNIEEGIPSVIGVFNLNNPVDGTNVVFSVKSIEYINEYNESPVNNAFFIDPSSGVLEYTGETLNGDVRIIVSARDSNVDYDFKPIDIYYHSNENNVLIIAGTVGGVVVALAIAGGTAAYFSKKKKKLA